MSKKYMPGKHFLQLPGPSNVPDRILRAMDYPTIDHRGPEFYNLANDCLEGIKTIFKTKSHVIICIFMYFNTLPDDKKQLLLVKISVILINTSVPKQKIKNVFS